MIRHFSVGDIVYYTADRKREIYEVTHEPTKRYQRYKLRALNLESKEQVIELKLDVNDPTWDCVFVDPRHALNDAIRRQQEYEKQIQRQADEWRKRVSVHQTTYSR
ncbi:hypothetical protein ALPO108162_09625 [Alicyclobacillus pomorum]